MTAMNRVMVAETIPDILRRIAVETARTIIDGRRLPPAAKTTRDKTRPFAC
jgi:hypothetical protein